MSYIPDKRSNGVPQSLTTDSWDRDISFFPAPKQPYDVRWLIAGKEDADGFQSNDGPIVTFHPDPSSIITNGIIPSAHALIFTISSDPLIT